MQLAVNTALKNRLSTTQEWADMDMSIAFIEDDIAMDERLEKIGS